MKNLWAITQDDQSKDQELKRETEKPRLDLYETASNLILEIDLPGMTSKEISTQVLNNQLILVGHLEKRTEIGNFIRMERSREDFRRVVDLPCTVDPERSEARYKNGVLILRLPKIIDRRQNAIKIPVR